MGGGSGVGGFEEDTLSPHPLQQTEEAFLEGVLGGRPARFLELAPQGIEVVGVVGLGRERDVDADLGRVVLLDRGLHDQRRPPDGEAAAVVARDEAIQR